MNLINNYLQNHRYSSSSEKFRVKGRFLHWTIFLLPLSWLTFGWPILFSGDIYLWLFSGITIAFFSFILIFCFTFEIRIDKSKTKIIKYFLNIPIHSITSPTHKIVIRNSDADGIGVISPRKDYSSEEVKNNLSFDYIIPWDDDFPSVFIDYKNKEVDLPIDNSEEFWTKLIEGLKLLDKG